MTRLRIALAQMHSVAGDLTANGAKIERAIHEATEQGAELFLTPEMAVSGYPVEDLLGDQAFIAEAETVVDELASHVPDTMVAAIGTPMRSRSLPARTDGAPARNASESAFAPRPLDSAVRTVHNVLALTANGRVAAAHSKSMLPTYGVFDDARWTVPGDLDQPLVFVHGVPVAFAICEDVWVPDVAAHASAAGARLLLVANASPFHEGKPTERLDLITGLAVTNGLTIAYCNTVGGQDELVFDGGSMVVSPEGELLLRAPLFESGTFIVDVDITAGVRSSFESEHHRAPRGRRLDAEQPKSWPEGPEQTYRALVTGLRDYVIDTGFSQVVIGLSGGLDSALAAVIAVDALGPAAVAGFGMPGPYSSEHSVTDARLLAENLGISFDVLSIEDTFEAEMRLLGPLLAGPGVAVATENIQARLRALHLLTIANASNAMMINTGNKSEASVGYYTLGGDSCGGFAILKDVYKTVAYDLSRWRNAEALRHGQTPPIPDNTITKPPSAELAPDQQDTDSLPPYEILDTLLIAYIEQLASAAEITEMLVHLFDLDPDAAATTVDRVLRMTDRSEHKRRQVAPGVKITRRAFGRDRRLPITSHRTHHLPRQVASSPRTALITNDDDALASQPDTMQGVLL